jgi:hypothetical protein
MPSRTFSAVLSKYLSGMHPDMDISGLDHAELGTDDTGMKINKQLEVEGYQRMCV